VTIDSVTSFHDGGSKCGLWVAATCSPGRRLPCGVSYIPSKYCLSRGCCYDEHTKPHCFLKGTYVAPRVRTLTSTYTTYCNSYGPMSVCVCVTSWCSVKTSGQIKLVFGREASLTYPTLGYKEIQASTKITYFSMELRKFHRARTSVVAT